MGISNVHADGQAEPPAGLGQQPIRCTGITAGDEIGKK
jgi:hypothetical protein